MATGLPKVKWATWIPHGSWKDVFIGDYDYKYLFMVGRFMESVCRQYNSKCKCSAAKFSAVLCKHVAWCHTCMNPCTASQAFPTKVKGTYITELQSLLSKLFTYDSNLWDGLSNVLLISSAQPGPVYEAKRYDGDRCISAAKMAILPKGHHGQTATLLRRE